MFRHVTYFFEGAEREYHGGRVAKDYERGVGVLWVG